MDLIPERSAAVWVDAWPLNYHMAGPCDDIEPAMRVSVSYLQYILFQPSLSLFSYVVLVHIVIDTHGAVAHSPV